MSYNEIKTHGTGDFPFAVYRVDEHHPKYVMAMHWHTALEIIRVISGKLTASLDGKPYELFAGDILFVNSESIHGATPENCVYECFVFQAEFLKTGNIESDEFIDDILAQNVFLHEKITAEKEKNLIVQIMSEAKAQEEGYQFRVIGLSLLLLGYIKKDGCFTRRPYDIPEKNRKLKTVLKFIRDNYAEEITLDDMAAQTEFSTQYFCSFFKKETNVTPVEYLVSYRIERAARKLLSTDFPVTQIAFDCGFNDLSYFIKTFRRLKGTSPKAYRQTERKI